MTIIIMLFKINKKQNKCKLKKVKNKMFLAISVIKN